MSANRRRGKCGAGFMELSGVRPSACLSVLSIDSIVVFRCNWVIMVKQLSNNPKVAKPSNNASFRMANYELLR